MKHISKLPGEKGYVYHPQRILDDTLSTIHGFSTLAANNKPHDNSMTKKYTYSRIHTESDVIPSSRDFAGDANSC